MTYAIVEIGGKQYRVTPGEEISVDRLPYEAGDTFTARTLAIVPNDSKQLITDKATLEKQPVQCKVVEHTKGKKIIVFKKKRRKGYKKKQGHRQHLTRITVENIVT